MAVAQRPEAAEATRKLFDEHARTVLAICRVTLRDREEAEDAAQQTFLSVHRSLLRGAVPRNPGAWIAAIARNECKARLRKNGSTPLPLEDDAVARGHEPHATELPESLAELPLRQREAVVLRDVFGLSHMEIATALGVNVGAVNPLLTRARGRLRNRLRRVARGAPSLFLPALRDQLAQLIPGFEASAGTATGAGAVGLAAKLASAPAAAKVAALVGIATVGATAPQLADRHARTARSGPFAAAPAPRPVRVGRDAAAADHRRRGHDDGAREVARRRTDGGHSSIGSGSGRSGGGARSGPSEAAAPPVGTTSGSGKTPEPASEPQDGGGPGPSATTTTAPTTTDGGASSRGPGGGGETTTATATTVEMNSGPGGGGGGETAGVETTHGGTEGGGTGSGKGGSGG